MYETRFRSGDSNPKVGTQSVTKKIAFPKCKPRSSGKLLGVTQANTDIQIREDWPWLRINNISLHVWTSQQLLAFLGVDGRISVVINSPRSPNNLGNDSIIQTSSGSKVFSKYCYIGQWSTPVSNIKSSQNCQG